MKKLFMAAVLGAVSFQAAAAIFGFSNEFSGGADCANATTGCATIEATQVGADVHFKLAGTMSGNEFITSIYGNSTGVVNAVNFSGATNALEAAPFNYTADGHKADGDGFFDWVINLSSNPPRFDGVDVLEWDFLGVTLGSIIDSISVNGPAGKTGFTFALHAQGLAEGSGWFNGEPGTPPPPPPPPPPNGVPEPGTLALAGLALAGVALGRHRKVGPEDDEDDEDEDDS
jgi:hypothetical protein